MGPRARTQLPEYCQQTQHCVQQAVKKTAQVNLYQNKQSPVWQRQTRFPHRVLKAAAPARAEVFMQQEVQNTAAREKQPQVPVHAGGLPAEKEPSRKGSGGPGGHQTDHEPEMCLCRQHEHCSGLHQEDSCQQVKVKGFLLLGTSETNPGVVGLDHRCLEQERHRHTSVSSEETRN